MMGIDPVTQRPRMDEALGVIVRLLAGEVVSHTSDWFELHEARLQMLPVNGVAADRRRQHHVAVGHGLRRHPRRRRAVARRRPDRRQEGPRRAVGDGPEGGRRRRPGAAPGGLAAGDPGPPRRLPRRRHRRRAQRARARARALLPARRRDEERHHARGGDRAGHVDHRDARRHDRRAPPAAGRHRRLRRVHGARQRLGPARGDAAQLRADRPPGDARAARPPRPAAGLVRHGRVEQALLRRCRRSPPSARPTPTPARRCPTTSSPGKLR